MKELIEVLKDLVLYLKELLNGGRHKNTVGEIDDINVKCK